MALSKTLHLIDMNKEEIINELNKYNLDNNKYVVISSSAMVLHGIKEFTSNIDIAVTPDLLDYLLKNYECELEKKVYHLNNIYFSIDYYTDNKYYINNIPILHISDIRKKNQPIIDNYINKKNILALAYLGDSIYEQHVRIYLLQKGIEKVNILQKESINYVSANSQAKFLKELIDNNFFTETELAVIKRARNHKSRSSKSTDIITYKYSTALEALIGYLYYTNKNRINDIMNYILK